MCTPLDYDLESLLLPTLPSFKSSLILINPLIPRSRRVPLVMQPKPYLASNNNFLPTNVIHPHLHT
jgi:hypothetical protein